MAKYKERNKRICGQIWLTTHESITSKVSKATVVVVNTKIGVERYYYGLCV
jgi:hypothetical protein